MTDSERKNGLRKVILATHNAGKVKELAPALASLGWDLHGLMDSGLPVPAETGSSFEDNATIKSMAAMTATGCWSLADDSGLEVDALGGAPGVTTAEYGGWERLLDEMRAVPEGLRGAQFVCVLALSGKDLPTRYFKGICRGKIAPESSGSRGFGYDPVFIPEGETRTFAAMSIEEKAALSHRGRAIALLLEWAQTAGEIR